MTALSDYFRRPVLAGNTLSKEGFGTVRGDLRRSDIDGTSTVPYFPTVLVGQSLLISIDGAGAVSAVMAGSPPNGMANVLTAINTALGITGTAFDADGTIAIQSNTQGSLGSVEITGGTAAAGLGFDLSLNTYKSYGGEIFATPEGRIGNPFGTAFLTNGENVNADSVRRGLARLSSNIDVLAADLARNDTVLRQVSFTTSDNTFLKLSTATDELFTGLGLLSNASLDTDLIPYFQLIDTATNTIAQSRVTGVVRGAPGGSPPFANASAWTGGGSAGNILGVTLSKTAASIDLISGGRVVKGSALNTTDVQPGDFAEISGATNTKQWSNNGNRWVVEQVLGLTSVVLRPMSKAEQALVGFTPAEVQPIIELNDELSGGESYGTLTIRTGTYCSGGGSIGISVYVSPPIPAGATYNLYVAQPQSMRTRKVNDGRAAEALPLLDLVDDQFNVPFDLDTVIGLTPTLSGGNCAITTGTIHLRGRCYNLPATTLLNAAFTDNSTNYVYWDALTTAITITTNPNDFSALFREGGLIAVVVRAAGVLTSVSAAGRNTGVSAKTATVGPLGNFQTLDAAFQFLNAYALGNSETTALGGVYPHVELVLINNITYAGTPLTYPSVSIRGAAPLIKLTCSDGIYFNGQSIQVRDLTLATSGTVTAFIKGNGSGVSFSTTLTNLQQTAGHFGAVVLDVNTSNPTKVSISGCAFIVDQYVIRGTPATNAGDIRLSNSHFTWNSGSTPQMITDTGATTWSGVNLFVNNCTFDGAWLTTSSNSLFVNATNALSILYVTDNIFTLGAHAFSGRNFMTCISGKAQVRGNRITGGMASIISGQIATVVTNNYIECIGNNPETAVDAGYIIGNEFVQLDNTDTSGSNACRPQVEAIGNYFHGPFWSAMINNTLSHVRMHGNRIDVADATHDKVQFGIWLTAGTDISIVGNTIRQTGTATNGFVGVFVSTTITDVEIESNLISFGGNSSSGTSTGVKAISGAPTEYSIVGNTVICEAGNSTSNFAFNVPNIDKLVLSNNVVKCPVTSGDCYGVLIGGKANVTISNNYLEVSGRPFDGSAGTQESWIITGNQFVTSASGSFNYCTGLRGDVSDNRFDFTGAAAIINVNDTSGRFTNNYVNGGLVLGGNGSNTVLANSNWVIGTTSMAAASSVNALIRGNNFLGSVDFATGTPTIAALNMTGNYFGGSSLTLNSGSTFDFEFSSNIGSVGIGTFSFTMAGGNFSASCNEFRAVVFTLNMGTSVTSRYRITGSDHSNITVTGTMGEISASKVGNLTQIEGFISASNGGLTVSGCEINGSVSTTAQNVTFTGNFFNTASSTIVHTRTASGGEFIFTGNTSYSELTVGNATGVTSCIVNGNYFTFSASSPTIALTSETVQFSNNEFNPFTNGPTVTLTGTYVSANGNQIFTKTTPAAANQNTSITFDAVYVWASNNYLYGHVITTSALGEFFFTNNYVYNLGTQSALQIQGISESGLIEGNFIAQDMSLIASDGTLSVIRFTGNTNITNTRIVNNRLWNVTLTAAYSGNTTIGTIIWQPTGNTPRLTIEGNIMTKPTNASVSGHTITAQYIILSNGSGAATDTVFTGNLMDAGGTTGSTGGTAKNICQGEWLYVAGPASLIVTQ